MRSARAHTHGGRALAHTRALVGVCARTREHKHTHTHTRAPRERERDEASPARVDALSRSLSRTQREIGRASEIDTPRCCVRAHSHLCAHTRAHVRTHTRTHTVVPCHHTTGSRWPCPHPQTRATCYNIFLALPACMCVHGGRTGGRRACVRAHMSVRCLVDATNIAAWHRRAIAPSKSEKSTHARTQMGACVDERWWAAHGGQHISLMRAAEAAGAVPPVKQSNHI